jgi:hypothetical protein
MTDLATPIATRFRGTLLRPGEEGYEEARRVWNGAIDRRPALIARCAGADDVVDVTAGEDDHLAAFDRTELLHDYAIVDLQRVLHGDRWDQEHLPDKSAQYRGNNHRADNNNRQFLEEGRHMLAEGQVLWLRIGGFGSSGLQLAFRLHRTPRRRAAPPVGHADYR